MLGNLHTSFNLTIMQMQTKNTEAKKIFTIYMYHLQGYYRHPTKKNIQAKTEINWLFPSITWG